MTTLDDVERTFDAETVLVCDENGPSGIAGIMGGQVSEVSEETTRVLLEVASWNGTNILRSSRMLSLRSEASSRFEKQLHPELCMRAQRIASRLMVELCGAKLVPGTIDVAAEIPEPRQADLLRGERVEGLLGMAIEQADQVAYLERLGFGVEVVGRRPRGHRAARPPLRRHPRGRPDRGGRPRPRARRAPARARCPAVAGRVGGLTREQRLRRRAEDTMRDLGFDEVVGWSFTDPGEPARLRIAADDPRANGVVLSNPLSEDQSVMRTTVLGSLLDVAQRNLARGTDAVALFESGRVYLPAGDGDRSVDRSAGQFPGERPAPDREPHRIGCLAVGPLVGQVLAGRW